MTDVALPSDQRRPATIGQATAVEQSRAVAEVQAAVLVAQNNPRNAQGAFAEMRIACGRLNLANRAFYSVPNRGNGPTVHLARELARIWGNVHYGVHELRRDDAAGESEIQAFAWDLQTNTRSTRTFVVPHARMKAGRRDKLTDLGDVYLNNQNVGARAVRECIFTVLPTEFTDEAQHRCRDTLEKGDGVPLEDRIQAMLAKFRELGVSQPQLEARLSRKRGQWSAGDVAQLAIVYTSITRDGYRVEEEFPVEPVTAAEILPAAQAPPAAAAPTPPADEAPADDGRLPVDEKPASTRPRPGSAAQRPTSEPPR